MASNSRTKDQLQSELDEANEYIEELGSKLDNIAGIATDEGDDDEDDSGDEAR
jgi:hypothetical protein